MRWFGSSSRYERAQRESEALRLDRLPITRPCHYRTREAGVRVSPLVYTKSPVTKPRRKLAITTPSKHPNRSASPWWALETLRHGSDGNASLPLAPRLAP